jgi:CelD/BcsL family acetyltransferase involved in cellulose biosynthesis
MIRGDIEEHDVSACASAWEWYSTIRVRELEDIRDVEALHEYWNTLLASTDNAVFSTWEWATCWWKHFGEGRRLRVLVAENGGRAIAIAPLMLSNYKYMRFGKLRKIEFLGSPQSDYNHLILSENQSECTRLFVKHIEGLHDWDHLELRDVLEDSTSARLLCDYSVTSPWRLDKRALPPAPYIILPPTFEGLLSRLRSGMRRHIARLERRLRERYQIDLKTYKDFSSVQEAMDVMFELHQKRRRSISDTPSAFAAPRTREFHSELAAVFAANGWLNLNFLTADDEAIAATYCFDYRGKTYFYQGGFDPRFSRYAVGTLLHLRNIEGSIRRGLREYDFLRGADAYKLSWPVHVRRSLAIGFARRKLLAKVLWVYSEKRRQLGQILRRVDETSLEYSGLPET